MMKPVCLSFWAPLMLFTVLVGMADETATAGQNASAFDVT